MKYFLDNCISFRFAEMLRPLGVDIVALREELPEDTEDVELFQKLKGRRLVFISTNTTQLTRQHEAKALKESGVTSLFFAPFFQKLKFWDQAAWMLRRWPQIDAFASSIELGVCAEIKQNGSALIYRI